MPRRGESTVGSERECSLNILQAEFRIILKDILIAHAGGEPAEHIIDRDAHPADTRFATAFPGFDGDAFTVMFHRKSLRPVAVFARA
jgi:hypothetical protein